MREIPLYSTFKKIESINKGMSGDKKYYIETVDKKHLLLRISDFSEYDQKKIEYDLIKKLINFDVNMPFPIDFGVCNEGKSVYTLLSWIEGEEVETILSTLTEKEQYKLGIESGKNLRKIHSLPAPQGIDDWSIRYFSVIDERLEAFRSEGIPFDGDKIILDYIETNKPLLENRPQCYHHGDYHMGNMILSKDGELFVIDWHTVDFNNYGDPWYEFNRLGTEFPAFASGQIDGYFNYNPPEEFWKLLAYYLSVSAITSIVWSKYFAPDRMNSILKLNKDILYWFDDMKNTVPIWYKSEFEM
ncbi:phosphotransferase [Sedimentibacter hydroxybenzoicus DSM 7310]|uniref:Phosphotransferase n=1 Tax=Sedimentibacter hydroxybenzoicus DSM 7310 TaxID=1123245 RepID=A0A974BK36_SEDHY|nr:phosphotransferase [Sedimentibacter hydroxybenzoicus]NYB74326.1 phosphotransferase [Sedimentibacter hydroxybenzoicus DSM 7310]